MRLAVFGDIHGNLAALEAVLEDISRASVDGCVVLGDVVDAAPDSKLCLERIMSCGYPLVRGNHERYVAHYGNPDYPEFSEERFKPVAWSAKQLGDDVRAGLLELPLVYTHPEAQEVVFVHASSRNDSDNINLYTSETDIKQMFADHPTGLPELVIRGHNHLPMERQLASTTIVTVGSAGLPLDGSRKAQYLLLSRSQNAWHTEHKAIPYDVDATIERFHSTGYMAEAGPVGRLILREVATATHQLGPFLRHLDTWTRGGERSLEHAVNTFLSAY